MSLSQKLSVLLLSFWVTFFIPWLLLKCVLLLLLAYYFRKHISSFAFIILMCLMVYFSLSSSFKLDQPYCGRVIKHDDNYVLLANQAYQFAFFMEHDFTYFDEVCVVGKLKVTTHRSNFFNDPITLWAKHKNHLGTLDKVQVVSYQLKHSLKGKLYQRLKNEPHNELLLDVLYHRQNMNHFTLLSIVFSVGLQYLATLNLLKKMLSRWMYPHIASLILSVIWLGFGWFWGFDFVWWRVTLLFFLPNLIKDQELVRVITYWCLLLCFSRLATSTMFIFLMVLTFVVNVKSSFFNRMLSLASLQHALFYTSDLLALLVFPGIVFLSGIIFLMTWLVVLLPFMRIVYNPILTFIIKVLSFNNLMMVGRFSLILVLISYVLRYNRRLKHPYMACGLYTLMLLHRVYPFYDVVVFLNVGQADASIVRLGGNRGSMMFDVGRAQNAPLVLNSLRGLGIKDLDGIVISHDDSDHVGGLERLMQAMPYSVVYTQKKDISFKQLYFQVLNQDYVGLDDNDDSLIGLIKVGDLSYLFMGDAGIDAEAHLIRSYPNLRVNVLKVGHHGSKSSTSSNLIASIQPDIGIISADSSIYGHPHDEVMRTLAQYQVLSLDTKTYGDLVFISFLKHHFVITSSGYFGIIR